MALRRGDDDEPGHWSPVRARVDPPPLPGPSPHVLRERAARRWQRTWLALALVAGAFVVGDLVGSFAPAPATWIDARTASARARLWASPDLPRYAAGAALAGAALLGAAVWLAGRDGQRAFGAVVAALALPAAYAGVLPLGQERALLDERQALVVERDGLRDEREALVVERDGLAVRIDGLLDEARGLAADRDAARERADALTAAGAALEEQLAAREARVAWLERGWRRTLAERKAQDAALAEMLAERDALALEVATLRSATLMIRPAAGVSASAAPP